MLKGNRENVYRLVVEKKPIQLSTQAGSTTVLFETGERLEFYLDLEAVESLIEILQRVKRDILEPPLIDYLPLELKVAPWPTPDIICDQKGTQSL